MIEVAAAIDAEAEPVVLRTRGADTYDDAGNAVPGSWTSTQGQAAIQPASGRSLQDLPEGIRSQVSYVGWTRLPVAEDNEIIYRGSSYRVVNTRPRVMDGFTRFAMGRVGP